MPPGERRRSLHLGYAAASARTLAAERDLARNRAAAALAWNSPPAELLLAAEHLPVVRSEEVFATQARCLAALARTDEAAVWRERAMSVRARKAASLADPAAERRMLAEAPAARRLAALSLPSGPAGAAAAAPGAGDGLGSG